MAIVDVEKGIRKELSIAELEAAAQEMRAYALISIHAAGTGHPGGSLSIMDIEAVLMLHEMNHDPSNPCWEDRDRLFFSAGHKAPALYVGLAKSGYFSLEDTVTLRRCGSDFQGHPHCLKLECIEISSGSLGQGLGVSVGDALAARLNVKNYRVYCIMGDGEQQEGSVWEAAMSASHFELDNLCAVVDNNRLQIDGWVKDVMGIDPIGEKYRSFGWHVIEIDGHNLQQIHDAFEEARNTKGKPSVIIANTIKGKGVSYMEDKAGWHGVATKTREQLDQALADLNVPSITKEKVDTLLKSAVDFGKAIAAEIDAQQPNFSRDYWWNNSDTMKVEMDPTRMGFGRGLERIGDDERIVTLHADISNSIRITGFEEKADHRKDRVFSVGIAEQNMMQVAAGFAKEGKIPITGTYGVFAAGRPWDQIRTTICYGNLNVKIAGAHGGISVGADGATHQALEEISLMGILPNMIMEVPADSIETDRATEECILNIVGPTYIRFAREATPIVTTWETPYKFGVANVIRFRGEQPNFVNAFETVLSADYKSENEDLCIIACGPMVSEAMRAAWILKSEKGIETRILNIHTVKPIDLSAILAAANEVGAIITAEEHQVGGFGNIVAGIAASGPAGKRPLQIAQVGVQDRFGESGEPWELMKLFELTAEHIAVRALKLLGK